MTFGKIPIRTHVIMTGEDIVEIVRRYTKEIAEPGDLIAVAESVVAICQRRAFLPEEIQPSWLAKFLCRFPAPKGSLSSPYSMQLAIQEVGAWRIMLGAVAAGLGRIFRRTGDFYRVTGPQVAWIDDVAGTMPPYDRHIVMGPKDPDKVAAQIKDATGVDAVIVDANDLKRADILGASAGVNRRYVSKLLEDNPFGNYDQQTPIVVVKDFLKDPNCIAKKAGQSGNSLNYSSRIKT